MIEWKFVKKKLYKQKGETRIMSNFKNKLKSYTTNTTNPAQY